MPTSGSDSRHLQPDWPHDLLPASSPSISTAARQMSARSTRLRRARRSAPRLRVLSLPRWKPATEATGRERRSASRGSVAVLEEPVALPQAEPRHQLQPRSVEAQRTILIVEDDPQVAGVIRESLALDGDAGWIVQTASGGLRALDLAGSTPPDVVLLDVRLPDLDGAEVYRRLRAGAPTRGARILFLTAGTSLDLYQRGIEDGVLLRKPFDVRDLVGIVRALLAG